MRQLRPSGMNYKVISIAVEPVILDIRYSVQNSEAIDASLESPKHHHPGHSEEPKEVLLCSLL